MFVETVHNITSCIRNEAQTMWLLLISTVLPMFHGTVVGNTTTQGTDTTHLSEADVTTWYTNGVQWTTERPSLVGGKIPLYLGGLFSLDGIWDGSGVYVGADLALKHVNENPALLEEYELMMTLSNSRCNDGVAIRELFDQIFQEPQELMIIGPACSTASQAIASTAPSWNLNIMSPTSSSPALSNRKNYPNFFRIIPTETLLNPSRVSLMKLYNWTRVATIHQNHEFLSLSTDDLLTRLRENNITVISSESFNEDPANQVENLKKQDAKIIVANMYSDHMRKVMCEAYKQGMYGDGYMWLPVGWYYAGWYLVEDDDLDCTVDEMALTVESSMYISVQARALGREDDMTVAGITMAEYEVLLSEHIMQERLSNYTLIDEAAYGYDSIWAVALALNRSAEILGNIAFEDGRARRLEDFTYSDKEMSDIFFGALESVEFVGVSGPISYSGSDRIGVINIEQLRGHCPDEWILHGRSCYRFVTSEDTMDAAVSTCADDDSFLVSIPNEDDNSFLTGIANEQRSMITMWWISLRVRSSGDLYWSTGPHQTPEWTPWDDMPADTAGSTCFVLDATSGSWIRESCSSAHGFICKRAAVLQEDVIARHDVAKDRIDWLSDIIWPGGKIPLDHTPKLIFTTVEVYETVPAVVYIAVCSIAFLGVLLAIVCLIFNTYYRNQRFIRMSSPKLNSLIIIGCILIYVSTCMVAWDSSFIDEAFLLRLCQIRVWLLSVGFVLSFGSMFSKTWRVHKVAALKNPKRVIITDRHLFIMVAVLLLVDVAILSSWFVLNPMYVERDELYETRDVDKLLILQPYILYCTSGNTLIWFGAIYGYKALLLLFGVFLAWETRKVTIPALNDSKLIGICVYNVVLLSAIGVGVGLALDTDPSISFIFTSAIQVFCTTVTLVIIFVPKMFSVRKYPEGKPVTTMKSATSNSVLSSDSQLKDENIDLRNRLSALDGTSGNNYTGCGLWCGNNFVACCQGETEVEIESASTARSMETVASHT